MFRAAASVAGIAALFVGIESWTESKTPSQSAVEKNDERLFQEFDRDYATGGVIRMQQLMGAQDPQMRINVILWTLDRQVAVMYPDVIACLGDPDPNVRNYGIDTLRRLPPLTLKIHLTSIQAAALAETNFRRQGLLNELAEVIDRS